MSVDYVVPVLSSRLQVVANAIDVGVGGGFLELLNSTGSVISSLRLYVPCGVVNSGVLTFTTPLIDGSVPVGGIIEAARCTDANGSLVISGLTVNGPSPDIHLTPTNNVTAGQTLVITAATITGN